MLAACLAGGAVSLPLLAAQPEDPESARKALDQVVERLNALDKWMNDAEKQRVRWEREVQQKDQEVAAVARRSASATNGVCCSLRLSIHADMVSRSVSPKS